MKQHEIIEIREKLLKKIRNSILDKNDLSENFSKDNTSSIFPKNDEPLVLEFAKAFTLNGGKFYYAKTWEELRVELNSMLSTFGFNTVFCLNDSISPMLNTSSFIITNSITDLPTVNAVISECEFLCARTGSVLMSSYLSAGRCGISTNDALVIIAKSEQILPDIDDAIVAVQNKYKGKLPSQLSFVSGPSKSMDVENVMVVGAHGSIEVFVYICDE